MKNGWFGWNLTECFQYEQKLQLTVTAVKLIILQWSPFSVQRWLSWCRACPFLFSSLFHDPTRESTGFYTLYKEKQMVHWLQYFAKNRLMQSCYVVAWHPIRVHVVVHSWPTQKGGEGLIFQMYCWVLEYVALLFWTLNFSACVAGVK